MATRAQNAVVYGAAAVQGIVLVTFPAASTILTGPSYYGLSSTKYGTLFLPQVILAITTSLVGAWLSSRAGTKPIYLAGLGCGLLAMVLLLISHRYMTDEAVAYPLLLAATAFVGAGFGLTVPALNSLTAAFHPGRVDASVLVLNAVLGIGTVLAPVFVAIFVGLGFWQGLPITSAILLAVLIAVSLRLPLSAGARGAASQRTTRAAIPPRFWIYAVFAVLYGVCETVNGNWAQLDMTGTHGASATQASLALTAFWAIVTLGRVLFASVQKQFPPERTFHLLPFALTAIFVLIAILPKGSPGWAIAAFGLAGLGCSALLPLTISFGQAELTTLSATIAGGVIACYQLGYGIAAFGVGPLLDAGVKLPAVYAAAAGVAAAMGLLSFVVNRRPPMNPATPSP
jgi:MFS family permease